MLQLPQFLQKVLEKFKRISSKADSLGGMMGMMGGPSSSSSSSSSSNGDRSSKVDDFQREMAGLDEVFFLE
jgi:hypothetical protein